MFIDDKLYSQHLITWSVRHLELSGSMSEAEIVHEIETILVAHDFISKQTAEFRTIVWENAFITMSYLDCL